MFRRYRSLRTKLFGDQIMPTLLDLPNELFLQIAASLSHREISRLMPTNRLLARLPAPALLERAISAHVGAQGCSILQWAAKHANLSPITRHLQRGISVDTQDKTGMTALSSEAATVPSSCSSGTAQTRMPRWTPLLLAAVSGNASVTALLLRNGSRGRCGAWWALFAERDALRCGACGRRFVACNGLRSSICCLQWAAIAGHGICTERYFGRMDVVRRLLGGGTIVGSGVDECADDEEEVRKRYRSVTATQLQLRLYEGCVFIDQD